MILISIQHIIRYRTPSIFLCMAFSASTISKSHADTVYTYDQNYQLTTALYNQSICVAYKYDEAGNRTNQTNTIGGNPVVAKWGSGTFGCFQWSQ